ncbi:MAG: GTPase HflX [Alicyclobacillus sp.]|nr:GTPase HflX [Alicyclobacillus sp.]
MAVRRAGGGTTTGARWEAVGLEQSLQGIVAVLRRTPDEGDDAFTERTAELIGLCEAAGAAVQRVVTQTRATADRTFYVGSGKVAEIGQAVEATGADVAVFDTELSPGQIRNLERELPCRVLDRTQLILDIFAQRARSREGMLQVEIAQLQYLLPRLTGKGVELSRLGGGIGTRGPGETKLEMDRRRIRERIGHLRAQLAELERRRAVQRGRRRRTTPTVALVGYTNAGKTTLLQRWTDDRGVRGTVEAGRDRLFDTLDPLARRVKSGATGELVVLDTVGFVQNLPHLLVDAFRATLEEAASVDLIVHVVDASHVTKERMETTYQVLGEIGALDRPVLTFYNKADLVDAAALPAPDVQAAASLYGSAQTGTGMDALYQAVDERLGMDRVSLWLSTRHALDAEVWSQLAKFGQVASATSSEDGATQIELRLERRIVERVRAWLGAQFPDVRVEADELPAMDAKTR